jgi:23S rRNA (guanosine2251-2'-O)-methyltransferase
MEDIIFGRNTIKEAIKNNEVINKVFVQKGIDSHDMTNLKNLIKEKRIIIQDVEKEKLDKMCHGTHQGIAAQVSPYEYKDEDDLLEKGLNTILILDEIQDPHNLGAMIRSAYAFGIDMIVISQRRATGVTSTVVKVSSGMAMKVNIARVGNINTFIDKIKDLGFWVYGLDMDKKSTLLNTKFDGKLALVIGSEGGGISRLTKEKCDHIVSVPMEEGLDSLNASVAASLGMFEIYRQRLVRSE